MPYSLAGVVQPDADAHLPSTWRECQVNAISPSQNEGELHATQKTPRSMTPLLHQVNTMDTIYSEPCLVSRIHNMCADQQRLTTLVLDLHAKFDAKFTPKAFGTNRARAEMPPLYDVVTRTSSQHSGDSAAVNTPPVGQNDDRSEITPPPVPLSCETFLTLQETVETVCSDSIVSEIPELENQRAKPLNMTLASSWRDFKTLCQREVAFAEDLAKEHAIRHANKKKQGIKSRLGVVVASPQFDTFIVAIVAVNSCIVGFQVEQDATGNNLLEREAMIAENVCSFIFVCELFCRVAGLGRMILSRDQRYWIMLDLLLVVSSVTDVIMENLGEGDVVKEGSSVGQIMKVARLMRVLRIFRFVRFLTKVRLMVTMICGSMMALFWLFVLILFVLYAFSIVLTLRASDWLKSVDATSGMDETIHEVRRFFGSLPTTMYTLYKCMTGGLDWGEAADISLTISMADHIVFLGFMFFTFFSVLNIVTGVFVDGAIQHANGDRYLRSIQAEEQQAAYFEDLRDLLLVMDTDGDGVISLEEWTATVEMKAVQVLLETLDIKITDTMDLFAMLDINGDGEVCIYELLSGFSKIKGSAHSVDLHAAMSYVVTIKDTVAKIADAVGADCTDDWSARRRLGVKMPPTST
eukprot:TRINITY_DN12699_c0_g1_i3.p1 TRINITY_DN12699_c0_g1~~TRINITY_DN12699_c0_g1_i3.p1  ORF type:complete len:636 (-),score=92.64 TRINITY_DN12699_c0_g1_i3:108-2015(-)